MVCKALASLDQIWLNYSVGFSDFNPQGSREPRHVVSRACVGGYGISIHKALASLDVTLELKSEVTGDFNPQGSREPRQLKVYHNHCHSLFQSTRLSRASTLIRQPAGAPLMISIHKALASLDSKIIQTCSTSPLTFYALCSSLPSSTNSVHSPSPLSQPFPLFFRCESPRHFMSAWHSHLV